MHSGRGVGINLSSGSVMQTGGVLRDSPFLETPERL